MRHKTSFSHRFSHTVFKKHKLYTDQKHKKTHVEVNLDVNTEQLDVNQGRGAGGRPPRTPPAPLGLQIKNIRPGLAGK